MSVIPFIAFILLLSFEIFEIERNKNRRHPPLTIKLFIPFPFTHTLHFYITYIYMAPSYLLKKTNSLDDRPGNIPLDLLDTGSPILNVLLKFGSTYRIIPLLRWNLRIDLQPKIFQVINGTLLRTEMFGCFKRLIYNFSTVWFVQNVEYLIKQN